MFAHFLIPLSLTRELIFFSHPAAAALLFYLERNVSGLAADVIRLMLMLLGQRRMGRRHVIEVVLMQVLSVVLDVMLMLLLLLLLDRGREQIWELSTKRRLVLAARQVLGNGHLEILV